MFDNATISIFKDTNFAVFRSKITIINTMDDILDYNLYELIVDAYSYFINEGGFNFLEEENYPPREALSKLMILTAVLRTGKMSKKEEEGIDKDLLSFYHKIKNIISKLKKHTHQPAKQDVSFLEKTNFKALINIIYNKIYEKMQGVDKERVYTKLSKINNETILNIKRADIGFDGRIAKVLYYYHSKNKDGCYEYFTYKDIKESGLLDIKSGELRRDVDDINNRVKKETSGIIEGVISMRAKRKEKEINYYRWEIILKKEKK